MCWTKTSSSAHLACGAFAGAPRQTVHAAHGRRTRYRSATCPAIRIRECSAATRTGSGPVWFPVNFLIIESLQKFHHYYGPDFQIEFPVGSGTHITVLDAAVEITRRLTKLFLRDAGGKRPCFGKYEKMQSDPHFRDYLLFHEFFHGDHGAGLSASHQTGWTAAGGEAVSAPPRREALRRLTGRRRQEREAKRWCVGREIRALGQP